MLGKLVKWYNYPNMPENFHDIIPPEHRSIRNITTSHRRSRRAIAPRRPTVASEDEEARARELHTPPRGGRNVGPLFSRYGMWVIALVIVIIFVLAFSLLFSGSKVTVVPKQRDVVIDGTFTASQTAAYGELSYELVTIERTATQTLSAAGDEAVEERASGRIIIFNNFSSSEQRLITNTRFQTSEGLVYRIDEPIVVPGQRTVNGKVVPGSIEVTVYADEPGTQYNIGLTDFTIPGFAGSPRFDGFYARSKTPMTGGFVGARLRVDPAAEERTREQLRADLVEELSSGTLAEEPEGFQLILDTTFATYERLPNIDRGNKVEIGERATLQGVLFPDGALGAFIAQETVAGFEADTAVSIENPDALTFSFIAGEEAVSPWEEETLDFQLTGNARLIWLFNENRLKEDLSGRAKDALPTILSGYEGIEKAEVTLRPFWKRSFPDDVSKITIEREL